MADWQKPVYFDDINHSVTHVLKEGIFDLSSVSELQHQCLSYGFGIKYVSEGIERYTVNRQSFHVKKGNYLLVNGEKDTRVEIDSKKPVRGMCIHLSTELVQEVVASFVAPDTPISDPQMAQFFYTEAFLENQYASHLNALGRSLRQIENSILTKTLHEDHIDKELFFHLASALVTDQTSVFRQMQNLKSVKTETKKDLFRRIYRGKEYIHAHLADALTIEQIAQEAGMSEFHFFRLFKQMEGVSPYQYILQERLQKSRQLLVAGFSVSETAFLCGFSSIFSFSKSFKKRFGTAPSQNQ